jgi:hypothetical protein
MVRTQQYRVAEMKILFGDIFGNRKNSIKNRSAETVL